MNTEVIRQNLASFIFVLLILAGAFLWNFIEYKNLQNDKINYLQQKEQEKASFYQEKQEFELQKKDFEIKQLEYKSQITTQEYKNNNAFNLKYTLCEDQLKESKIQTENISEKLSAKSLEIEKYKQIIFHLEENKSTLENKLQKMNGAEKISNLISEYTEKYGGITIGSYNHYSDYSKAVNKFEAILGLINTYHLNNEFSNFIRTTTKDLYR